MLQMQGRKGVRQAQVRGGLNSGNHKPEHFLPKPQMEMTQHVCQSQARKGLRTSAVKGVGLVTLDTLLFQVPGHSTKI
jgi:hypothetical protein